MNVKIVLKEKRAVIPDVLPKIFSYSPHESAFVKMLTPEVHVLISMFIFPSCLNWVCVVM